MSLNLCVLYHELLVTKIVGQYRVVAAVVLIDGFPHYILGPEVLALDGLCLKEDLLITHRNGTGLEHVAVLLSKHLITPLGLGLDVLAGVQVIIFELDSLPLLLSGEETVSLASFVLDSDHQK